MGTVEGDIHDIGKDIVNFMLEVNEFEVRDIGIDVPAEKFVDPTAEQETEQDTQVDIYMTHQEVYSGLFWHTARHYFFHGLLHDGYRRFNINGLCYRGINKEVTASKIQ